MREGMKGFWSVQAGILPGEPIPKHTKNYYYLSAMYDADVKRIKTGSKDPSTFQEMRDEAIDYAKELIDPRQVNWVRLEWVWV